MHQPPKGKYIDYYGAKSQKPTSSYKARVFKRGSITLDDDAYTKYSKNQNQVFLGSVALFQNLSEQEIIKLANEIQEKSYPKGTTIISPGQIGAGLYVIKTGSAKVYNKTTSGEEEHKVLQSKDFFGEAAQLENVARGRGVVASDNTVVLVLPRTKYNILFSHSTVDTKYAKRQGIMSETTSNQNVGTIPSNAVTDKSADLCHVLLKALQANPLFADVSPKHLNTVVNTMWLKVIPEGQDVVKQGNPGEFLYVVEKGFADVIENDEKVFVKTTGNLIGELALFYNAPLTATVHAITDMVMWTINRSSYKRIITDVSMAETKVRRDFVDKVGLLKPLSAQDKHKVADALEKVFYPSGTAIIKQGDIGDAVYFIIKGKVSITKEVEGATLDLVNISDNACFGERALVKNERRAAKCSATSDVECYRLANSDFVSLLGPLEDVFKAQEENYNKMVEKLTLSPRGTPMATPSGSSEEKHVPRIINPDNIQREELEEVGLLGKGSFGTVNLVQCKRNNKTYALKSIGKAHVVKMSQEAHIMNEKQALVYLDHPFVIQLEATYQDRTFLYFLMECVLGGELFSILRTYNILEDSSARFYAASILLVFEHMHKLNIIYRDLKPENILLDQHGYVKLTDFGFAKELTIEKSKAFTLCGTPDYLAPEVLTGVGHGKGVDWWCLGIMIYEMLVGQAPFFDQSPTRQYAKIKGGRITYPKSMSEEAVNLIAGLLKIKPTERLGIVAGGSQKIKAHSWFRGFSFDDLIQKKIKAPWVPPIKNEFDRSNFDEYDDEPQQYFPFYGNQNWCKDF